MDSDDDDKTLHSPTHTEWAAIALRSGMTQDDIAAVGVARMRLTGAVSATRELMGDLATAECVAEVMRHIRDVAGGRWSDAAWPVDV